MTTSTLNIFQRAQEGKYAIPAFNVHNLEITKAVLETAEEMQSPVLLAATPGTNLQSYWLLLQGQLNM